MSCKINAARFFDVSVAHLEDAYAQLNGKKIDGFYITDLIDRHGFSDGKQMNRADLARKYNHNHIRPVDVASNNLKQIVRFANVRLAYEAYLTEYKNIFEKSLAEKALTGE